MSRISKFRVHLPYECLFDLRWGFIRKYSGLSDFELYSRFNGYCSRLTDNLSTLFPSLPHEFKANVDVVKLSPRTAIVTLITNTYRQFASETPGKEIRMHITIDFANVKFITRDIRDSISKGLAESMSITGYPVHVTHTAKGYDGYSIRDMKSNFNALIVYSILDFMEHYNPNSKMAFHGIGIITRPFFLDGKTPEDFHRHIASHDKKNLVTGKDIMNDNDHYDILSDVHSHIGPIYFHEPEYFSAIMPE